MQAKTGGQPVSRPRFRGELYGGPGTSRRQTGAGTGGRQSAAAAERPRYRAQQTGAPSARPRYQGGPQAGGQGSRPRYRGEQQAGRSAERPRYQAQPSGQSGYSPERARMMAARRKKRAKQRRMILGGLLLVLLLVVGGSIFGITRWLQMEERKEYAEAGVLAAENGDYEGAIAAFDQALGTAGKRLGTFETNVLLNRAEAEYKLGDHTAALDTYRLLMESDEENELYREGAALCLAETGAYQEALALNVLQSQIYNRMAADAIEAGQYDEALGYIEQGRSYADSSAAQALDFNEAVAWEKKADFAKALDLFETYADKYGADEVTQRELAFLRTRQGNGQ